jgi:beta-N-acetylhexosaminidase
MREFTGGEFIVMGVPAETLDTETTKIIEQVQPAGFILFARNIKSPQQLRDLTDSLRKLVKHEPIITIDQEGGRVSRLKEFMSEPPSARQLAQRGDKTLIEKHGKLTGQLLRLFGFNVNLAPVLDVELNDANDNSLGSRTYGRSSAEVIANATTFAEAMTREGILCCGKHFPGYSAAKVDPHHALPTVQKTREEMMSVEWVPFTTCAPKLDLMMMGHVIYPKIDASGLPATLSPYMVHEIVRDQLKFKGCTITDDMDMGAIANTYGSADAAARALAAGNDIMLVCHNMKGVPEIAAALKKVPREIQEESFARIEAMRKRLAPPTPFSMDTFKKLDQQVAELRVATLGEEAKQAVASK